MKIEIDDVVLYKHLEDIYGTWHGCRLRESEMYAEDYARGLVPGMVCDDCRDYVKAHILDIKDGAY